VTEEEEEEKTRYAEDIDMGDVIVTGTLGTN
jgi:hypothetical protein